MRQEARQKIVTFAMRVSMAVRVLHRNKTLLNKRVLPYPTLSLAHPHHRQGSIVMGQIIRSSVRLLPCGLDVRHRKPSKIGQSVQFCWLFRTDKDGQTRAKCRAKGNNNAGEKRKKEKECRIASVCPQGEVTSIIHDNFIVFI